MSTDKRDATPEEVELELKAHMERWNLDNPGYEIPEERWREKQAEAIEQGYKSEVCGVCLSTFLAFHHFTTCQVSDCPFSTGESVLDTLSKAEG